MVHGRERLESSKRLLLSLHHSLHYHCPHCFCDLRKACVFSYMREVSTFFLSSSTPSEQDAPSTKYIQHTPRPPSRSSNLLRTKQPLGGEGIPTPPCFVVALVETLQLHPQLVSVALSHTLIGLFSLPVPSRWRVASYMILVPGS